MLCVMKRGRQDDSWNGRTLVSHPSVLSSRAAHVRTRLAKYDNAFLPDQLDRALCVQFLQYLVSGKEDVDASA